MFTKDKLNIRQEKQITKKNKRKYKNNTAQKRKQKQEHRKNSSRTQMRNYKELIQP